MIQVINRGLDILELIASNPSRLYTLSEISGKLKLNNGTCANIIKTLVSRGYIEQESRKKGYRLGSMAYLLTGNYSYKKELLNAAIDPMNALSELLNENCILAVLKNNSRIILYDIRSSHELQILNQKEKDAYLTSTGRMILACLDDAVKKEFVQKFGIPSHEAWNEIRDEEDLMIELNKIKKKELSIQISKAQIVGLAVPIYKNKIVIASLGVYLPLSRYTPNLQAKILEEIQKTGASINYRLNANELIFESII